MTICNRQGCGAEVVPASTGRPKAYCSEQCRWRCHHFPSLRIGVAPKTKFTEPLGTRITVVFTAVDRERIVAEAVEAGLPISDWVRDVVRDAMGWNDTP